MLDGTLVGRVANGSSVKQQAFSYLNAPYPIREDLSQAHRSVWAWLAAPGSWWTGTQRVSLAEQVRQAYHCPLCTERKAALSPYGGTATHGPVEQLPENAVDAVHRIATDASRLTKAWLESCFDSGLSDGQYVELLGVAVCVISIDRLHQALGLPLEHLPEPEVGQPTGYRPEHAAPGGAWVPMLPARGRGGAEADLYEGLPFLPNVIGAMSLVPDCVRMLKCLSSAHYLDNVQDPRSDGGRALSRPQIELVAGRVSAINECFY